MNSRTRRIRLVAAALLALGNIGLSKPALAAVRLDPQECDPGQWEQAWCFAIGNADCSVFNTYGHTYCLSGIATCSYDPDDNSVTFNFNCWDYGEEGCPTVQPC